jgi:molybdopterin synthase sulfur carrier subunit
VTRVRIPTPLRSYTQRATVEADGATLDALLRDLDARFPGLRFRVVDEQGQLRAHMRIFVNEEMVRDLASPVDPGDEVTLMQALSGGADRGAEELRPQPLAIPPAREGQRHATRTPHWLPARRS